MANSNVVQKKEILKFSPTFYSNSYFSEMLKTKMGHDIRKSEYIHPQLQIVVLVPCKYPASFSKGPSGMVEKSTITSDESQL